MDRTPWLRIKARFEAGESVPSAVREMAESVLGERFVRAGQGKRPDVRDRAAGDDSFDDRHDGGVVAL